MDIDNHIIKQDEEKPVTILEKVEKKMNQSQKISITKAALKEMKGTDNSKININYQPIMIVNEGNKEEEGLLSSVSELRELIWVVLQQLPHPKLQNLRKLASVTAIEKLGSTGKAAKFFNMQRTYMSRLMTEAKEEGIFTENLDYHKCQKSSPNQVNLAEEQGEIIEATCLQMNVQKVEGT